MARQEDVGSSSATKVEMRANDVDIQNLSANDIYVSRSKNVDASAGPGIKIATDEVYSFTSLNGVPFYLIANTGSGNDVRIERA